jgi:hypothetical protein
VKPDLAGVGIAVSVVPLDCVARQEKKLTGMSLVGDTVDLEVEISFQKKVELIKAGGNLGAPFRPEHGLGSDEVIRRNIPQAVLGQAVEAHFFVSLLVFDSIRWL